MPSENISSAKPTKLSFGHVWGCVRRVCGKQAMSDQMVSEVHDTEDSATLSFHMFDLLL